MIDLKHKLANRLKQMYDNAPYGEQSLMIRLFEIKFAEVIRQNGYTPKGLLELAGMSESYQTEINKGIKIAKYVEIKKDMDFFDL